MAAPVLLGLAACSNTPTDDSLNGKWRLRHLYSKALSTDTEYGIDRGDMTDNHTFYTFQLALMSITSPDFHNGHSTETIARFAHEGDRLNIGPVYIHFRDRDSLLTDPNTRALESVGIRGNAARFRIIQNTSTRLILCSEMDSLVFTQPH